jgi:hypothetical protein
MPRRAGRVGILAALAAAFAAACTNNSPGPGGCRFTQQAELPGTPLTLIPDARLDTVGDGFMLSGLDADGTTLRWAAVDGAGAMGQEHSLPLTGSGAGSLLTFTTDKQPGDTMLLGTAVSKGADAELHVTAVPAAGASALPAPGPALALVAAAAPLPLAALASTRTGSPAVLAWADPGAGDVKALWLSPAGQPIGAPVEVSADRVVACMAFVPGKQDLTLAYYTYPDAKARVPVLFIAELLADGTVGPTLQIVVDGHAASCPRLIATDAGYAFVFQDSQGSWLASYRTDSNRTTIVPFAPAVDFGGAAQQPSLAGLATAGADYAVVFSRAVSGELWRVSGAGTQEGVLSFPSAQASFGQVSTQPLSGGLAATYADYTAGPRGAGTGGVRIFLGTTCL